MSFLFLCVVNFLLPLVRRRFLEPVSVDLLHFELEWTNVHFEPLLFAHPLPLFVVLLFLLLGLLVFAAAILGGQAVSVWYMVWRRGYRRRRVARVPLQL